MGLGRRIRICPDSLCCVPGLPVLGHALWSSTFLPAVHQGTYSAARRKGSEEADRTYSQSAALSDDKQRKELDLLSKLNRIHLEHEGGDPELEASIQSAEIAFRMQKEAPDAFDITKEPEHVRARYGDGDFARAA